MLNNEELLLLGGLVGLFAGWVVGRIAAWLRNRRAGAHPTEELNRRIRSLEADLRVAQRKAEEAELALEKGREESDVLRRDLQARNERLAEHERDLQRLRMRLGEECSKTHNLRQELTAKAEETIRATVRVRDAENELSVARAGSDAVMEEVRRLAAEREQLTGRLRSLQAELTSVGQAPKVARLPLRESKER